MIYRSIAWLLAARLAAYEAADAAASRNGPFALVGSRTIRTKQSKQKKQKQKAKRPALRLHIDYVSVVPHTDGRYIC
jgi:hypothetical protein